MADNMPLHTIKDYLHYSPKLQLIMCIIDFYAGIFKNLDLLDMIAIIVVKHIVHRQGICDNVNDRKVLDDRTGVLPGVKQSTIYNQFQGEEALTY